MMMMMIGTSRYVRQFLLSSSQRRYLRQHISSIKVTHTQVKQIAGDNRWWGSRRLCTYMPTDRHTSCRMFNNTTNLITNSEEYVSTNNTREESARRRRREREHCFPLEALQWHSHLSGFLILIHRSIIIEFIAFFQLNLNLPDRMSRKRSFHGSSAPTGLLSSDRVKTRILTGRWTDVRHLINIKRRRRRQRTTNKATDHCHPSWLEFRCCQICFTRVSSI